MGWKELDEDSGRKWSLSGMLTRQDVDRMREKGMLGEGKAHIEDLQTSKSKHCHRQMCNNLSK